MGNQRVHEFKIWQDPQLRAYLGEVRRKCGVVETLALPSLRDLPAIQIETLFVPPLLCAEPVHADDDPDEWPAGRNLLAELQEFKQIVVLGDPGGGKTTLSNWLAWRLTSGSSAPLPQVLENKVPFPCILREMPSTCFERGFTVADLAVAVVRKLLGNVKADHLSPLVRQWVDEGNYVLILDGIDEVAVPRRQLIASWIKEAHRQDAVVLATSRVVGYEDYSVDFENAAADQGEREIPAVLDKHRFGESSKRPRTVLGSFHGGTTSRGKEWAKLRYLMPFNKAQISDFSRNWYSQRCVSDIEAQQRASDLLASLAQSEITSKLARTPNLLSLMAIVHRERAHLPDGKALLYDEIVNAYLNTIDSQRRIGEELNLARFGWKEKKSWLAYVGFKLQESRSWGVSTAGILASEEQVLEWLETAIRETDETDYEVVAKGFLNWVARRSGLLLPRGDNRYAFVHLSFQEYFCSHYLACSIVRPAFVKDRIASGAPVTKEKVADWGQNPAWLETYIFLFESLSAEHGFDWVESLIEIVFVRGEHSLANLAARLVKNKHVKLPAEVRDFLALGCTSALFAEADYKAIPDSEVFRIMVEVGYTAYLSGDGDAYEKYVDGSLSATKVRVLIAVEGVNLNAKFLSHFTNLEALSIVGGFVDLAGLNRSSELGYLRVRDAEIANFDEVGCFTQVRSLELRRLDIADISSIKALKELSVLEISDVPIMDLSPLRELRNVSYLEVSFLKVADLTPLSSLKKLVSLHLRNLPDASFDFVGGFKQLEILNLFDVPLKNFDFLMGCKKLESLDVSVVDYVDLAPLANLPKLEVLFLSDIGNVDISPVAGIKKLAVLMMERLTVNDLFALAACRKLLNVYFTGVEITNPSSLSALKKVRALTLRQMQCVKDLGFLTEFKKLEYLDLRGTKVSDVSVLDMVRVPFGLRLSVGHGMNLEPLLAKEGFDITIEDSEIPED